MTRPDEPATLPEENVRPSGVRSDERRRLLRGGLAAGPVLMTIMSRPVLGQTNTDQCGSATVKASFQNNPNTSLNPVCRNDPPPPAPRPARYSATGSHALDWPSPYVKQGKGATLFESPTTGLTTVMFPNATMLDVLQGNAGGGAYRTLAKDVATALLNAAQGRTPYLSATTIRAMWNSVAGSPGYYEVSPGIRWNARQVANYLQGTWSSP